MKFSVFTNFENANIIQFKLTLILQVLCDKKMCENVMGMSEIWEYWYHNDPV